MIRAAAALLAVLALPGIALAETRKVPSEEYPTIQSAINGIQGGDVILVSRGTYEENLTISGNAPFTMKGKGNPVIDADGGDGITLAFVSNISISGFVIENANEGVFVTGCSDIVLSRIAVLDAGARGFRIRNNSSDITVAKCSVSNSVAEGLLDEETTGLVVDRCSFTNTGYSSVALSPYYFTESIDGSDGAVVTRNRITGAGLNGIHFGGNGVLVSKNRVEESSLDGIVNDPNTATLGAIVEKNRVSASGSSGIVVSGSGAVVSKNAVAEPNQNGIVVTGNGGHLVEKNKVTAADVRGIRVISSGNTLVKNKASGSGDFDLYDSAGEGANTYEGNRFGTTFFASPP